MKPLSKITIAAALLFSLFLNSAKAQTDGGPRAQNVYVELGGPGLLFSANYDTRFSNKRDGLGGRIGAGYIASNGNSLFTLPIQANYLLGKQGKYFEIGLGATFINASGNGEDEFLSFDEAKGTIGTMTFGYRYQPVNGGFNFRASINPIFNSSNFIPYFAGISIGYTF
jgi:hypothetical protein